jgi:hypothetical protein
LNCHESTDEFLKVVPEGRFVMCMKCNHINNADDYDPLDFHKACVFESNKITLSSTSSFKKNTEVAYISSLSDLTRSQTKREAIKFESRKLDAQLAKDGLDHQYREKKLDMEIHLEQSRSLAMQALADAGRENTATMKEILASNNASMKDLITSIAPKKTQLDIYLERKATIAAMIASQQVSNELGESLLRKLDEELLNSNLM